MKHVYKNEGIGGFWAGVKPNVTRTFLVNAAEIGSYDSTKAYIRKNELLPDGLPTHLTASAVAGLCAAVVATPVRSNPSLYIW